MRKKESRNIMRALADAQKKIQPCCPYMGTCGGCFMQDVDYDAQLDVKQAFVQKLFDEAGIGITIPRPEPSPEIFYYRNRMDFPVGENGEVGLKPMGRWMDVLDLSVCYLQSPESVEIMRLVREWMKRWKLAGWNAVRHHGYVRYVVIREGKNTGERMVMLVTHAAVIPNEPVVIPIDPAVIPNDSEGSRLLQKNTPDSIQDTIWSDLVEKISPLATTIYHAINPRITDVSYGDETRLLHGEPLMRETINGSTMFISPFSFFQTNTHAAERLQQYVVNESMAGKHPRILDLYCGSGFFTLPLAQRGAQVVGVELDAASIDMAKKNAKANGITGATFHTMDAKQHALEMKVGHYDTIIVDPPRAGLHPKVIRKLIACAPLRIIYVSCAPARLAHELPQFLEQFTCASITTFDMFPHTPHVETVLTLVRRAA